MSNQAGNSVDSFVESIYTVKTFYRSIFSIAAAAKERGLVIYGAGHWGNATFDIFQLFDVTPICFCDDDESKIGKIFHDVEVLSLDEAVAKHHEAVFLVGAITQGCAYRPTMLKRLMERGISSEYLGFTPIRYLFLLNGGLRAAEASADLQEEYKKLPDNYIIFNHSGNSGSTYFHTLIDGHPNILTMPFLDVIGARESKIVYLNRIQFLEGVELITEIAAQLCFYLKSSYLDDKTMDAVMLLNRDIDGKPNKNNFVDSNEVVSCISALLKGKGTISYAEYVKISYLAYNYAAGKNIASRGSLYIFQHVHDNTFDFTFFDNMFQHNDFKRFEYWFIIREPINHVNSVMRLACDKNSFTRSNDRVVQEFGIIKNLITDTGYFLRETENNKSKVVKILRFEDVKRNTRGFMHMLCEWLEIEYDPILLTTTLNGMPTYYQKRNKSGVIGANDMSAISDNDYSKYLTSFDIFRLNLLYQDFKKAYEYACDVPDYKLFSEEFLKELLSIPFKFEEHLHELACDYLRRGLIEEIPDYHSKFVGFWIDFMKKDHVKLAGELFKPLMDEREGE